MRILALLLVSLLSYSAAVAAPSNKPVHAAAVGQPIRVDLVNMSGQRRQIRLKTGDLDLPVTTWVAIDTHVGATLLIVSDTHTSLEERIVVKGGDDARVLRVQ